jgi:hypothetical protein
MYAASKFALVSTACMAATLALSLVSSMDASARPAWFGPGSGPVSPYANYKGFAQVSRQAGAGLPLPRPRPTSSSTSYLYSCVPNVGLVGANGMCPD